ncbi:Uncharacterised protein [Porphyromonas macacae]|uniref:Uncharacterized protein n=1 Tax=Porphyromonas macacae TaxID=28115 RepID=A0A379EH02_9PORP|nr:Uncharacterised protein [Porphyromonas macacae]
MRTLSVAVLEADDLARFVVGVFPALSLGVDGDDQLFVFVVLLQRNPSGFVYDFVDQVSPVVEIVRRKAQTVTRGRMSGLILRMMLENAAVAPGVHTARRVSPALVRPVGNSAPSDRQPDQQMPLVTETFDGLLTVRALDHVAGLIVDVAYQVASLTRYARMQTQHTAPRIRLHLDDTPHTVRNGTKHTAGRVAQTKGKNLRLSPPKRASSNPTGSSDR